ncbi:hypothetical protein [Williamsia sp. M5A3_1d]
MRAALCTDVICGPIRSIGIASRYRTGSRLDEHLFDAGIRRADTPSDRVTRHRDIW